MDIYSCQLDLKMDEWVHVWRDREKNYIQLAVGEQEEPTINYYAVYLSIEEAKDLIKVLSKAVENDKT